MKPYKLERFQGINNVDEPWEFTGTQIGADKFSGRATELVSCSDFDITNAGKLLQRDGRTLALAGAFTNLWNANGTILAVRGGNLCSISSDFTGYTVLRSGFGAHRVSYVNINSITVYSDSVNIGYFSAGAANVFPTPTVEFKQPIPAGQLVEYYKGRLLVAHGRTVSQSDPIAVRFAIDVNPASGGNSRQFASEVTLLKAVTEGVWMGDSEGIWWCAGDSLTGMKRVNVSPAKPFLGMAVMVKPEVFREPLAGKFFDIATDLGVIRLGENGYFQNLTTGKYTIPSAIKGCMAFLSRGKLNQTITVFEE